MSCIDANDLRRDNVALLVKKREIEITGWGIPTYTDENWDILAEVIRTTTSLGKLVFEKETAIALQNDKVADALAKNLSIKTLDLWKAHCCDEGAKAVAAILKENSMIEEVKLSNNISEKGAKAIADALKVNKTLQRIDLSNNELGDEGTAAIAEVALKQNTSLQSIDLDRNKIDNEGAKVIAEALKENVSLRELYVGWNNIADQGAKAIAEALKKNTSLRELYIESNNIGDEGAKVIAEALKENTSLQGLYIQENIFGVVGTAAIAEALKKNTSLQSIDLDRNKIDNEGAKVIAEALKENPSLRELYIGWNNIGDQGARAIAEALKENTSIQKLGIECNNIGEEGGQHILNALQQIETSEIKAICLWGGKISEETRTKIDQEIIRIQNRFESASSNEGPAAAVVTAAGKSQGAQNKRSSSNEDEGMPTIHTTNASQGSAENVQETNETGHNTTAMETKIKEQQSIIAQLQNKIAEQDKELASTKDILKTIGNLANGKDGGATSITESSIPDREIELQSEIERYKQEVGSLKEQLKNSRPIETVDLTNEIEPASGSGGEDSKEKEPPPKRRRTKSNLAAALEMTQQIVQVKEEAKERAAVAEANVASARREKDAVEASLRNVQEDLEDSNELVTQQTLTTDIWQGRFDELFELARDAGVDGNRLSEIRYRPLSSGR